MSEYSSGIEIRRIKNRTYSRFDTPYGDEITAALEKCGVPYFARYNGTNISLTYDSDYADVVNTVISKAQSSDFELLERERSRKNNNSESYKTLLPEIARVLNASVGQLEERPAEIRDTLCKTYISMWLCDDKTMKRELSKVIDIEPHEEQQQRGYFSIEQQRRVVEKIENEHINRENAERRNYYELVRGKFN